MEVWGEQDGNVLFVGAAQTARCAWVIYRDAPRPRRPSMEVIFSDGRHMAGEMGQDWAVGRAVAWVRDGALCPVIEEA